jgi:hypothetical protein
MFIVERYAYFASVPLGLHSFVDMHNISQKLTPFPSGIYTQPFPNILNLDFERISSHCTHYTTSY